MIGRKLGMMRLYDGAGRVRAVTVIDVASNRVTDMRSTERDGYVAVQVGHEGNRKRLTRAQRGHLRRSGVDETLSLLREFAADDSSEHSIGDQLSAEQFEAGSYVNVRATSKGRGFAGGVRRWNFRGGPKTHGQSDRHRAPGSVGAGTTPGKVWKGQKMAGHMGARQTSVLNLLVVASDPERELLFVEGSVPGPRQGLVAVTPGRKSPLEGYEPPELPEATEAQIPVPPPVEEPDEPAAVEEAVADNDAADDAASAEDASEDIVAEAADDAPAEEDSADAESEDGAEPEGEASAEAEDETADDDADEAEKSE